MYLAEEQIFKQYEQAQEWERLALEAQIESYQNENSWTVIGILHVDSLKDIQIVETNSIFCF